LQDSLVLSRSASRPSAAGRGQDPFPACSLVSHHAILAGGFLRHSSAILAMRFSQFPVRISQLVISRGSMRIASQDWLARPIDWASCQFNAAQCNLNGVGWKALRQIVAQVDPRFQQFDIDAMHPNAHTTNPIAVRFWPRAEDLDGLHPPSRMQGALSSRGLRILANVMIAFLQS